MSGREAGNKIANSLIGAPIERFEDLRFLRGKGVYVGDLKRPNLLHAVVLRSQIGHGRIRAIDATAARAMPGVHLVLTARDIAPVPPIIPVRMEFRPEYVPYQQPVLAYDKVRYVGEPIALVVADSAAIGEDALEQIMVDIESLPAVVDCTGAASDEELLFEVAGTNAPAVLTGAKGDVDAVFATAPYTRKEHFKVHRHSAATMEMRGLLAEWDAERKIITCNGAAKMPFMNRTTLSKLLGLPEDNIFMVENDVGGGFGVRGEFYPEDFLIPYAAMQLNRPVKWEEDRRENFLAANHSREAEADVEIACDRDGTVLGMRCRALVNCGAYLRTSGTTPARNIAQVLSGPYRIENLRSDAVILVSNKTPSGPYRGPGRYEADFFRERMFDLAADDLGLDRVEFRLRNLVPKSAMPWPMPVVGESQSECDSGDYAMTLKRCLEEFRWTEKAKLEGQLIEGEHHGIAVGCYVEGTASGRESTRLKLEHDGTVTVSVGSAGVGQGVETVFAQIAADALGLPLERINRVRHGSTDLVKNGVGSFTSRSVVMAGSALLDAAAKLKEAIRAAAAQRFNCSLDAVRLGDGVVEAPGRTAEFGAFADALPAIDGTFATPKRAYSYGAHAAHIAVDIGTGRIRVVDYVAVEDVGRIINPGTLHGQCLGAIVQGLGGTLLEHFVYDAEGQMLSATFADYLLPTATDFPSIKVIALEEEPSPVNPLGAKGAGEGGVIPVGGLIANALANALSSLDVKPNQLPLSPAQVWSLAAQAAR